MSGEEFDLMYYSSLFALFGVQLFLCFRTKRLWARLIPTVLTGGSALLCVLAALVSTGWDSVGYAILAMLLGNYLVASGIAWAIWGIARWVKKRKSSAA